MHEEGKLSDTDVSVSDRADLAGMVTTQVPPLRVTTVAETMHTYTGQTRTIKVTL